MWHVICICCACLSARRRARPWGSHKAPAPGPGQYSLRRAALDLALGRVRSELQHFQPAARRRQWAPTHACLPSPAGSILELHEERLGL
eukprot:scaffold2974_cov119-Isochrysis_galbana.AAC.3